MGRFPKQSFLALYSPTINCGALKHAVHSAGQLWNKLARKAKQDTAEYGKRQSGLARLVSRLGEDESGGKVCLRYWIPYRRADR